MVKFPSISKACQAHDARVYSSDHHGEAPVGFYGDNTPAPRYPG